MSRPKSEKTRQKELLSRLRNIEDDGEIDVDTLIDIIRDSSCHLHYDPSCKYDLDLDEKIINEATKLIHAKIPLNINGVDTLEE